jgi:hypothetical protein
MPEIALTGEQIRQYLLEVAQALPSSARRQTLIVVGGSLLAMHDLRDTTVDADSVLRLTQELLTAAARVARAHDLSETWLNDRAAMFAPATLREADCSLLIDHPRLLVLGAPLRQIFLMKLYAYREPDRDDLLRIRHLCGFTSPQEVAAEFHEAYPHVEQDPYLVDLVAQFF